MVVADPPSDTIPVLPAQEPAKGRMRGHRRSFATARVILALMLREMTTRYGRSPGGYIWAILEPLGAIVIMSYAFSLMLRSPSLGNSFIVFYASGHLVFTHYTTLEKTVNAAIPFSRGLLKYPVVTWLDAILARYFLNMLTSVLNTILIMWGTIYFTVGGMIVDLAPVVEAMALASVLALGMGTLNAYLIGISPLFGSIYRIVTRPLMLASAVLYIMEDLPSSVANLLWYNPLVHLTGMMRSGIFATYDPQYISVPYVLTVALVSWTAGLILLWLYADRIMNLR